MSYFKNKEKDDIKKNTSNLTLSCWHEKFKIYLEMQLMSYDRDNTVEKVIFFNKWC